MKTTDLKYVSRRGLAVCLSWVLAASAFLAIRVAADTMVVSKDLESTEAIGATGAPFGFPREVRAQTIYSPSLFPVFPAPQGLYRFDGMAFRMNSDALPGTERATFDQVRIFFSTSARTFPSGFGQNIDQNHGSDKTLVFDQNNVTLTGSSPGRPGPAPFDIQFTFSESFYYDPTQGSLVVEIWKNGQETLPALDCCGVSMRTFYERERVFLDSFSGGVVTQFSFESVPEPNVLTIIGLSILLLLCRKKGT